MKFEVESDRYYGKYSGTDKQTQRQTDQNHIK